MSKIRFRQPGVSITFAIIALWMACMQFYPNWKAHGGDWASVAIAARLAINGEDARLYARAPGQLLVEDASWSAQAEGMGYSWPQIFPFLYPPLVAYVAVPVSTLSPLVKTAVLQSELALLALTIALSCFAWRPDAFQPWKIGLMLVALSISRPLGQAIVSMNVQPLVIFMVVVAMAAAQRKWALMAGSALAVAAFIKITPAILVLYWLCQRRFACAAYFGGAFAFLVGLSLWAAGLQVHLDYLRSLTELSANLLPVFSNKGLPAFLYDVAVADLRSSLAMAALPQWIPVVTAVLSIGAMAVVLAGAKHHRDHPPADAAGMMAILLIGTVASPIAWSHYFTLLAPAFVIWLGLRPSRRSIVPMAAGMATLASVPLVGILQSLHAHGLPGWAVGGELIAALLLLALLLVDRESERAKPTAIRSEKLPQPALANVSAA